MAVGMNGAEQFRDAIRAAGLTPPDVIEADGKLHRFASNGKRADDSGWYVFHDGDVPAGAFGCWRGDVSETWRAKHSRKFTAEEKHEYAKKARAMEEQRAADEKKRHDDARERAARIWKATTPVGDHPYLKAKAVKAHRTRYLDGMLIVPMRDAAGELHSLQFIGADGEKKFLTGGRVAGCYFVIGKPADVLCICEGFATGASAHEATGYAVAVAFNAGNLEAVAKALREKYPEARIIVAGDNDESGVGQTKAKKAAEAVGGVVAIPAEAGRDWNDIHREQGAEAVKRAIEAAVSSGMDHPAEQPAISQEAEASPAPVAKAAAPARKAVENIGGAALLEDVRAFIARFVAFQNEHCLTAVSLWAAHTHMVEHLHTTPRIAGLSPEPESGKTRLLEILELLTANSMLIFSPSVAAIFRKLAQQQVTLLFDEVDTIFTKRGKDDQNEDLRALLNAGYRRGASIPRCVGPKHDVQDFRVFAAVALAGIGDLPETVMTRSIVIRMRRRSAAELIEQFRVRVHEQEGHDLRDRLATWAATVGASVGAAWPELPEGVVDRRAEAWEPLIAIADAAGGDWPSCARAAAVSFVTDVSLSMGVSASLGIRLLADLRQVFEERDSMATADILEALVQLDEAPWAELHGKPLNARGLSTRLGRYGISRRQVRIGDRTAKGYRREDLHDAWVRYLPPSPPIGRVTKVTKGTECPRCSGEGCAWCK